LVVASSAVKMMLVENEVVEEQGRMRAATADSTLAMGIVEKATDSVDNSVEIVKLDTHALVAWNLV
jgi:hypothetical protein